jgi:hypothetical protein
MYELLSLDGVAVRKEHESWTPSLGAIPPTTNA